MYRLRGCPTSLNSAARLPGASTPPYTHCLRCTVALSHLSLLLLHTAPPTASCPGGLRAQRRCYATTRLSRALPPPPPLPGSHARSTAAPGLPPPPPLSSSHSNSAFGAGHAKESLMQLRTPQDVLAAFIPYIPTFYVSVPCVASMLPDELRDCFLGRGRLVHYLARYPFMFEVQMGMGTNNLVRLHRDVSHPQRGEADAKFMMSDVGETTSYLVKPEFIVSTESLEAAQRNVYVVPPAPPPSVRVSLEERVPVVERLRGLVPETFVSVEELEESIPEDVLFHPYFNCQGGLLSIAGKLPEEFQVVDGRIRRRPRHLAPLALGEFTLENSPLPEVAAVVRRAIGTSDIPHWVRITPLYEQLTRTQRLQVKQQFKSFAGFLRAHGRALAVANDMLQVSRWVCVNPPPLHDALDSGTDDAAAAAAIATAQQQQQLELEAGSSQSASTPNEKAVAAGVEGGPVARQVTYSTNEVLNALYDRFPPYKTLTLREAVALLPLEMRTSGLPAKVGPWLATHPDYFTIDYVNDEDPDKVLVRRASERQPLDLAAALYAHMPVKGHDYQAAVLLGNVDVGVRRVIEDLGVEQLCALLPQWLHATRTATQKKKAGADTAVGDDEAVVTLRRLQESEVLEKEMQRRAAKKTGKREAEEDAEDAATLSTA